MNGAVIGAEGASSGRDSGGECTHVVACDVVVCGAGPAASGLTEVELAGNASSTVGVGDA
jgi:hypothetical protein